MIRFARYDPLVGLLKHVADIGNKFASSAEPTTALLHGETVQRGVNVCSSPLRGTDQRWAIDNLPAFGDEPPQERTVFGRGIKTVCSLQASPAAMVRRLVLPD
jgi:hypothetical protein